MEREITLRDYGRVLWSGRWVLVAAAVGAALVALVVGLARQTTYTSSSIVYMGLATTARTGVPVSTPLTTPLTAQKTLRADEFIQKAADGAGVDAERVRDGVTFTVERIPGAAGGNQPVVATIRYRDRDKATSIKVVNAYADGVFDYVQTNYANVLDAYQKLADDGQARIAQIRADLDRFRAQGAAAPATVLISLQQELATTQLNVDDSLLGLAKTKQIEQPKLISKATSAASSARPGALLRNLIFGVVLGLILGAVTTFVWKGSPGGHAPA